MAPESPSPAHSIDALQEVLAAAEGATGPDAIREAVAGWTAGRSPEDTARIWLAVAEHWTDDLTLVTEATRAAFQAAWQLPRLFDFLEENANRSGDPVAADAALRARARLDSDPSARANAWAELGDGLAAEGDPIAAAEAFEQMAIADNELAADALHRLERLPDAAGLADIRERVARRTGDQRQLLRIADERFRAALAGGAGVVDATAEVAPLAVEVTGDLDAALSYIDDAWESSRGERPALLALAEEVVGENPGAIKHHADHLSRLAAELEAWENVARWQRRSAELAERSADRAGALIALSHTLSGRLGDHAGALTVLESAANDEPAAAGTIAVELETLEGAASAELAPSVRGCRARCLEAAGDWGALWELVRGNVDRAEGADKARMLVRLADIESERLGRSDLAASTLDAALDASPDVPTFDDLVSRLDGLAATHLVAAKALARARGVQGNHAARARALRAAADLTADPGDAAALLADAGSALESAGDTDGAIEALQRSHGLDARAEVGARLRRLLTLAGRPDEALALIGADGGDIDERLALLAATGRGTEAVLVAFDDGEPERLHRTVEACGASDVGAAADRLATGDSAAATRLLWTGSSILGHQDAAARALALRAYELGPLGADEAAALEEAIPADAGDEARRYHEAALRHGPTRAAVRAARLALADALANEAPQRASALLDDALSETPDDAEALDRRLALARTAEDPTDLARVLDLRLEQLTLDESEAVAHLEELMGLYAADLGREDLAFDVARRLLEVAPANDRALAFVHGYTDRTGDDALRYETLASTVEDLEDPEVRASRLIDLAEIARRLGAGDTACAHLVDAASTDGAAAETRESAARAALDLALERGDHDAVVNAVSPVLPVIAPDARAALAEEAIDRIAERSGAHALRIAEAALAGWDAPEAGVWDRHAQLARTHEKPAEALGSLRAWMERDGDAVPIDRRAQRAVLELDQDPTADAGWTVAADVLAVDPGQFDLVLKLDELRSGEATLTASLEALASALVDKVADEEDADTAIPVLYRAADLAAPTSTEVAETAWRAIIAHDPTEDRAVESLRGALRDRGDVEAEDALLAELADRVDEERRLEMLRERAALTDDDDELEARHLAVLEADISDVPARLELARLYERTDRPARAAELLEEAAPFTAVGEAKPILEWAARLYSERLEDPAAAATALEAVLQTDPTDHDVLARLADNYRARDAWDDLVRILEHAAGVDDSADRAARRFEEIARIREREQEDRASAVDALERVIELEPGNLTVLQDIARLHEESENWDAFVAALDRIAAAAPIPELRREILLRAAPVLSEKLDRAEDAQGVLAQAFEAVPPSDDELELLGAVTERSGRWMDYAAQVRSVVEQEEDDARRERWELALVDALADKAKEPAVAVRWLAERMVANPTPGPRLEKLEAVAEAHGLEPNLVETYKALTAAFPDDKEVVWHALSRSARIAEKNVGHPEVAFGIMQHAAEDEALRKQAEAEMLRLADEHDLWDTYRGYLSDSSESADADAVDVLVRRAAVEREHLGDWKAAFETLLGAFQEAPFDERVRDPLFALADEREAWPFVAKLLEVLQESASGAEKAALVREIAIVYGDRLGDPGEAFAQQLRAWQLSPSDNELLTELEARAEAADRQVDLLAAYEWYARQPGERNTVVAALDRAAALAVSLSMPQRAVALYARMAELGDPTPPNAVVETATRAFGPDSEHPVFAADVALAIAASNAPTSVKLASLVHGSEVAHAANDVATEIACLREASQRAPAEVRPLLIDALRRGGEAGALASELEASLPDATADDRIAALSELVTLYSGPAADEARALAVGRKLVESAPDSEDARDRFIDLLTALERWPDLVDFHLKWADDASDSADRRSARLEAARVAEEFLDDPRRAVRIADIILDEDPVDRAALELRARSLAALGRWKDHIDALVGLAEATEGAEAALVYGQAAEALESQLVHTGRAAEMWELAAEADPSFGRAYAERARLIAGAGDVAAALPLWERAVDAARTPTERAAALTAYATACRQTGADADIVALLAEAVEADPRNVGARMAYEEALAESGDIGAILGLLDEELERATDDAERAMVLCRRAVVCALDAGNEQDALSSLQRARDLGAGRGTWAIEGDVHLLSGRWAEAAAAYVTAFGEDEAIDPASTLPPRPIMAGEDAERRDANVIYLTRAGYAHEAAGRIGKAQDYYVGANLEDDSYGPALVGLARLALRRGNPDGASIYIAAYRASGPYEAELDEQMAEVEIAVRRSGASL